jgi:hypothetical protein
LAKILNVYCVATLFFLLRSANASIVTFDFSGTVSQVPVDEVFGDIADGTVFSGSFSFDTSTPDLLPGDPATGSFIVSLPAEMTVLIGTHMFSASDSLNIGVLNSFVDQYSVLASGLSGDLTMELFLQDNSGTVFTSDGLPLSPPPMDSFTQKDFHLDEIFPAGELQVDGQLTALTGPTVPEPSPGGLTLAGSFALLLLSNGLRASEARKKQSK